MPNPICFAIAMPPPKTTPAALAEVASVTFGNVTIPDPIDWLADAFEMMNLAALLEVTGNVYTVACDCVDGTIDDFDAAAVPNVSALFVSDMTATPQLSVVIDAFVALRFVAFSVVVLHVVDDSVPIVAVVNVAAELD